MRLSHLLYFCLFFLLVNACQSGDPKGPATPPPAPPVDPNVEMARLLDSLARAANPADNYHLNSKRAALWAQRAEQTQDPNQQLMARFQMGSELLNAGKLEDAIRTFEGIRAQFQQAGLGINDQTKALYELLAVAYLRLGEQQNCLGNYAPESCILPLQKAAFHKLPTGSQKAIEYYTQILETYPDDLQTQWLLNLAHMTLGQYPEQVPAKWRIAPGAFRSENPDFPYFRNVAPGLKVDVKGSSGGVCMDDFNNDGLLDIFATAYGYEESPRLFINSTEGFVDRSAQAGIQDLKGGLNTTHADYDNDGDIDIYVLRGGWLGKGGNHPNSLLRNNSDGTFTDVTKTAGLLRFKPTQTAAWGDFNNDGWVDLFVGAEATKVGGQLLNNPCELWLNKGDGSFEEVAAPLGIEVNAFVKGCSWGDFNNDGWMDLYISSLNSPNFLFVNQPGSGPTGRMFKNIAQAAGVAEPVQSFPAWFWDYDNDGFEDLFVSGYDLEQLNAVGAEAGAEYSQKATKGERPRLYKNNGNGTFSEVAASLGLDRMMYSMGANFGDLDNDGFLDFYVGTGAPDYRSVVPNRMFRNKAGQGFEEVTMSGFGHIQKGHGVAFGDLDNDGDQDIYAVMGGAFEGDVAQNVLFENPHSGQDWVTIQLVGTDCNRSAIGAKVEVQLSGGRKIYRTVSTGGSFGASSLQLEIGLGTDATIEQVLVYWPGKFDQPQAFPGIEKNRFVQLTQGQAMPKYQNRPRLNWH